MATDKLNIQDKVELDKFTKFLALKSTQIIVQSRLGKKIQTHCKPNSSGNDWFNLAIQDLPDVLAEAKRALCEVGLVTARLPLCVEISLKTIEGDSMALETWSLEVRPEQRDPAVLVKNAVYDRMGILLKSLVSVTRVTPAYKLSRRQGPDSYVICYVIYLGEAQLHKLGEGYKEVMVGQLCTAVGTICLSVSYRTKMTISPQHTGRDNSIMLKSDHFNPDLSPRHHRYQQSEDNNASLSETIKVGAFADGNRVTRELLEPDLMMPEVPFSNLMTPRQQHSPSRVPPDLSERGDSPSDDGNGNATPCNESRRSSCSMVSANEDFIMVDLVIQ